MQATAATGDDYSVEASVSGPISDDIQYRLSGKYRDRGGQLDNVVLDTPVDYSEEIAVRGHLHWDVSDTITADLRGSYVDTDAGSLNFTFQGAFADTATGLPTGIDFTFGDADLVERDFVANNLGNDQREVGQISLRLKADLGFAELASTTAYDTIEQLSRGDQFPYTIASTLNPSAAFFNLFDGTQTQFVDVEAFSQELRLTSTNDGPLRWMVGGYYLSTDRFISSTTGDDLEQGIAEIRRTADFNPSNPINSFFGDDNDNEAFALFANIDYAVTDRLELAFAGRYDEDKREQTVSDENGFYANGVLVGTAGNPGGVNEETFSEFQPKVTARYLVTDTASIYGSWG